MKKVWAVGLSVCFISGIASAVTVQGIDLDFVTIGNAGNAADSTGYGAVGYEYQIGKYEITNGQWNTFVSLAGVPTGSPSSAYDENPYWTGTNMPTSRVSWYEAAQFCNYLTSGDKYSGAYNFDQSGNFLGIDRASSFRKYGTTYVIPTEDEWYKAAYYTSSGYSLYANGQNSIPEPDNGWNYYGGAYYSSPWDVGTGIQEQNGTYDMMGNVWEWNEAEIPGSGRGVRGGGYAFDSDGALSSFRRIIPPDYDGIHVGFRVASVPEPATLSLLAFGGLALLRKQK